MPRTKKSKKRSKSKQGRAAHRRRNNALTYANDDFAAYHQSQNQRQRINYNNPPTVHLRMDPGHIRYGGGTRYADMGPYPSFTYVMDTNDTFTACFTSTSTIASGGGPENMEHSWAFGDGSDPVEMEHETCHTFPTRGTSMSPCKSPTRNWETHRASPKACT